MSPEVWAWGGFGVFVLAMLALDLGVFHRSSHTVSMREALTWSAVWIGLAAGFNALVWWQRGAEAGLEFLAGYLVEKSLSVDNLFVFVLLFGAFRVPPAYQHKLLFWGVLGALVMRAGFIFAGIELLKQFHWVIYLFGGILLASGVKMAFTHQHEVDYEKNIALRLFKRIIPTTTQYDGDRFFTKIDGRWLATPLFVALLLVETTDLIFAVDSIPAILAISRDPFIVFTSNVFAILGLRSLYFALAGMVNAFPYLHYGLAAILGFVGIKMLLTDTYKIPIVVSLGVIAALLVVSIVASLLVRRPSAPESLPQTVTV